MRRVRRPQPPAVLIDASNICRDASVRPVGPSAAWERLEQLTAALRRSSFEFSRTYVVADASLAFKLDERGRRELRVLEREGLAEQCKFADERLLELAFGSQSEFLGALIVSHDFFDDFRRRYPELETASAIGWESDEKGDIAVALRDFGARTHLRVSRKEEETELVERRLRRREVQERAFASYFQCVNPRCLVARLWPRHIEELPRYDEKADRFVCPGCGEGLEVVGIRQPAVQVIGYLDGTEMFRIIVEEGGQLALGRSDANGQVGLDRYIPKERMSEISRRHLVLTLRNGDLFVADNGSKNGSSIGHRTAQPADRQQLRDGEFVDWMLRDVVFLPAGITLERSGRRLPMAGDRADDRTRPGPDSSPTTNSIEPR